MDGFQHLRWLLCDGCQGAPLILCQNQPGARLWVGSVAGSTSCRSLFFPLDSIYLEYSLCLWVACILRGLCTTPLRPLSATVPVHSSWLFHFRFRVIYFVSIVFQSSLINCICPCPHHFWGDKLDYKCNSSNPNLSPLVLASGGPVSALQSQRDDQARVVLGLDRTCSRTVACRGLGEAGSVGVGLWAIWNHGAG